MALRLSSLAFPDLRPVSAVGADRHHRTTRPKRMGRIPHGWSICTRQMRLWLLLARLALEKGQGSGSFVEGKMQISESFRMTSQQPTSRRQQQQSAPLHSRPLVANPPK